MSSERREKQRPELQIYKNSALAERDNLTEFVFVLNEYVAQAVKLAGTLEERQRSPDAVASPHSQKLWLLPRSRRFRFHLQTVDVGDGDDGGGHVPGQTHEGAHHQENSHPEQIQMVTCPFLPQTNSDLDLLKLCWERITDPRETSLALVRRVAMAFIGKKKKKNP